MLVGLTILRNGTDMGYPWVESILSVIDFVDHFHIGDGMSWDNTYDICKRLKDKYLGKVTISRYEWPQMDTGFAIGAATNEALMHVRRFGGKILYVQGDELWHPDSVREMARLSQEDYDAFSVPFLHLEHNCQIVQQGAGYKRAIRMVANKEHIKSHRDAWTFEGFERRLEIHSLPHPLVHANYCFWENVVHKKEVQAAFLYKDLGHYLAAAENAREWHDSVDEIPAEFLRKTSPFEEHLSPIFLPMLGSPRYYVREELLL